MEPTDGENGPAGRARHISDEGNIPRDHPLLASPEKWASAADNPVSLVEVRRALATIRGSLSDAVMEERRDRWGPRYFVGETLPEAMMRDLQLSIPSSQ